MLDHFPALPYLPDSFGNLASALHSLTVQCCYATTVDTVTLSVHLYTLQFVQCCSRSLYLSNDAWYMCAIKCVIKVYEGDNNVPSELMEAQLHFSTAIRAIPVVLHD